MEKCEKKVRQPSVLCIQLRLKLPYPGLHLGHCLLSAPQRILLCFIQPRLGLFHLGGELSA